MMPIEKKKEERTVPAEFEKTFQAASLDTIIYSERNKGPVMFFLFVSLLLLIPGLGISRLLLLKYVCIILVAPMIGIIALYVIPKVEIKFRRKSKEITIYWKGILSKSKVYEWNDVILDSGHIAGRMTTHKIDIINKVTNEFVVSLVYGRDEERISGCISFLNDYMAGNPLKEHYYIEKKKDEHFFDQD
jgi:hypothetical protein